MPRGAARRLQRPTCKQCNPTTGRCDGARKVEPATCEDGNACTPAGPLQHLRTCVRSAAKTCNSCNACDPHGRRLQAAAGSLQRRDRHCTTDTCSGGQCVGTPIACNDLNECTRDGLQRGQRPVRFAPIPDVPGEPDGAW